MERIYIIGKKEDNIKQIGFPYEIVSSLNNDDEIDNWIINFLQNRDVDKLIIDLSDDTKLFLKIGFHIRLSLEELREKSLIPLLFVSVSSLTNVLVEGESWSHILTTKGVYFSSFERVKTEAEYAENLKNEEYKMNFLNHIHILPDEKTGRHSLANIWGAYAMDKAAGTNAFKSDANLKKHKAKLYFKYVSAFNFNTAKLNPSPSKVISKIDSPKKMDAIDAKGKKILLIDDEAHNGWETVLRKIFITTTPNDFVIINKKVKDYESFSDKNKDIIENTPFDLYLVDLRLNGIEEENTLKSEDFSGMKVLKKIKSINQGNQVIMFTASNKVWNLKALLNAGADGYYMKESPDLGFSNEFSEQNYLRFQKDVNHCFNRYFLFDVYEFHQRCYEFINIDRTNKGKWYNRFYDRACSQLEIAFGLLKQSFEKKYLNFAYLSYYQILEDYADQSENFEYNERMGYYVNDDLVIDKTDKEWKLIFIEKKTKEEFNFYKKGIVKEFDEKKYKNLMAFPKISFILAYKFNEDNSFLEEWGRLHHLRNTVAVHGLNNKTVTVDDVYSLLEIVELFLTNP